MMMSGEVQYFRGTCPLVARDRDNGEAGDSNAALKLSIPPRYRDGMGGIDLEQVRRDRRRSRNEVMRGAIVQLSRLRRRR